MKYRVEQTKRAVDGRFQDKLDVPRIYPALLGDGLGSVQVSGQPGWVYVRIGSDLTPGKAFNGAVPNIEDLAVLVGYDPLQPGLFQVLRLRQAYTGQGLDISVIPQIGPHHETHEWMGSSGSDVVYVHLRQWMPLRVRTVSAFTVQVDRGIVYRNGWTEVATQQLDLSSYQPRPGACYVLLYLDADGALAATAGSTVTPASALAYSDIPTPAAAEFPLAAVRLYGGQTAIQDTYSVRDVVDLRWPQANQTVVVHDEITLDANADTLLSLSDQELGLDTQAANTVFAGPTAGVDAVPAFRALVEDDIPSHEHSGLSRGGIQDLHAEYVADGYTTLRMNPLQFRWNAITSVTISETTYQAIAYWDADGYLVIGKRELDGDWTLYTYDGSGSLPTIQAPGDDNHDVAVIGIDPNGYIHVCYSMHVGALNYRKSAAAIDSWTGGLGAEGSMLGTNEAAVTYPTFINDPSGVLYFLFRDGGSGDADLYFYTYAHATSTWSAATGTGAGGKLYDGKTATPDVNPYWFHPAFDADFGSGGYMHLAWGLRDASDPPENHDLGYAKWDGTDWEQADGDAQTVPITPANQETVDLSGTGDIGFTAFNSLDSDSSGNPHLVYPKTHTDGYRHLFHAYHDGVSWTITQLTTSEAPEEGSTSTTTPMLVPSVAINQTTDEIYVFYTDDFDAPGILCLKSSDGATWTKHILYPYPVGWYSPKYDYVEWRRSDTLYFSVEEWRYNDDSGAGTADQLAIRVLKWDPDHDGLFDNPFASASTDETVKVSSNDTTAGYLTAKIVTTDGLQKTDLNDGGDEDLQLQLHLSGLTEELSLDGVNDEAVIYDNSASAHRKVPPWRLQSSARMIYAQTADLQIVDSTLETTLLGNGAGSVTIPANSLIAGSVIRIFSCGELTDTGTPSPTLIIALGGATIATVTPALASVSGVVWTLDASIHIRTIGGAGTAQGVGLFDYDEGTEIALLSASDVAVDTTSEMEVELSWTWDVADASNDITSRMGRIEVLNPPPGTHTAVIGSGARETTSGDTRITTDSDARITTS